MLKPGPKGKPVAADHALGLIWLPSQKDTALHTGLSVAQIRDGIKTGKVIRGVKWRFANAADLQRNASPEALEAVRPQSQPVRVPLADLDLTTFITDSGFAVHTDVLDLSTLDDAERVQLQRKLVELVSGGQLTFQAVFGVPMIPTAIRETLRALASHSHDAFWSAGNAVLRQPIPVSQQPPIRMISHCTHFNSISAPFQQQDRFDTVVAGDNLRQVWHSMSWSGSQLLHQLKQSRTLSSTLLRTAVRRRLHHATQFSPHAAKAVYLALGAKRVLDPCFGWGDRFAAALATDTVECYHGIDCRSAAATGFAEQCSMYEEVFPDTVAASSFQLARAEDAVIPGAYDTVFTSPPAFNKEIYPGVDRWPSLDSYYTGFLIPMLGNAWNSMSTGGHLAIHLADRQDFSVCERMLQDVLSFPRAQFKGYIGIELLDVACRSPWVHFCEPVWVWSKM